MFRWTLVLVLFYAVYGKSDELRRRSKGLALSRAGKKAQVAEGRFVVSLCGSGAEGAAQERDLAEYIKREDANVDRPAWKASILAEIVPKKAKKIIIALQNTTKAAVSDLLHLDVVCDVHEDEVVTLSDPKPKVPTLEEKVEATFTGCLGSLCLGYGAAYNWGRDRIDQADLPLDLKYAPNITNQGSAVNVYILDTGLDTTHAEFTQSSSRTVANVIDYWNCWDWVACVNCYYYGSCETCGICADGMPADNDGNSHGTHVAGLVGGGSVGVAPEANLYALKVLNDYGSGWMMDIIMGLYWVIDNGEAPGVVSLSLGGYGSWINSYIEEVVDAGFTAVVAAGNSLDDACDYTPAGATSAFTVGSTTSDDEMSWFSNWGSCVDLWAPGSVISSALSTRWAAYYLGWPWYLFDLYMPMSGTSMATPHVSGVAALFLSENPSMSPVEVKETVRYYGVSAMAGWEVASDDDDYSYSYSQGRKLLQDDTSCLTCDGTCSCADCPAGDNSCDLDCCSYSSYLLQTPPTSFEVCSESAEDCRWSKTLYYIQSSTDKDFCLTVPKADTPSGLRNGLGVIMSRCLQKATQKFTYVPSTGYIHPNGNKNFCLDFDFDNQRRRPLTVFRCGKTFSQAAAARHQSWIWELDSAGSVLVNAGTGMCVALGRDVYQGRGLQQWDCDKSQTTQKWIWTEAES